MPNSDAYGEEMPVTNPSEDFIQEGVGFIPKQVTDILRGQQFANWDAFKVKLWQTVYSIPHLRDRFILESQTEMAAGRAPYAPYRYQLGGRNKFEIDHAETLKIYGERTLYNSL